MYAIGGNARNGFGAIPALAVSAGISLLSGIFGSKSGKTTHAQRFLQAQAVGDTTLAHLLIDQAYSHAFIESIPDKADWMQVWQVMLNEADAGNREYMQRKLGVGGTGGVSGSPYQPGTGPLPAGFGGISLPMLALAGAAVFFVTRPRGRRR